MGVKETLSKWEVRNSFYVIFGIVPIANSFAFFHMSTRVKNKKWTVMGWVLLVMNILLITSMIVSLSLQNPNEYPTYDVRSPNAEDYMTEDQIKLYSKDSGYVYSDEFKDTDEYLQYRKAYDEWSNDALEWSKRPEIEAKRNTYVSFEEAKQRLSLILFGLFIVMNFVFFAIIIVERPKYLRMLSQRSSDRENIQNRVKSEVFNNSKTDLNQIIAPDLSNKNDEADNEKIDLNSADEDELSSLQGLTVIDAKKAIAYRNENDGFKSVDEFFTCINAKPHIIVRLENKLSVGEFKRPEKATSGKSGRRTLDI